MGSRRVSIVLTALITLGGTLNPASLPGTPPAPPKELRERRERLVGRLRPSLGGEERGAFLWRSGKEPGQDERFRPDPNFFYLTGHEEPGASMLLSFTRTAYEETLLLPARDPSREKWTGAKLGPGAADPTTGEPDEERHAAMRRTGFGAVAPAERLDAILESRSGLQGTVVLWARHDSGGLDEAPTEAQLFLDLVRSRYPKLRLADPAEELALLRVVKSQAEISLIEKAIAITCEAQLEAMRALRASKSENELHGIIEGSFLRRGALGSAFLSIVAAGRNATVLHYASNSAPIGQEDVVVIDIGAEFGRYAADVTRSLPASGRFTPRQREVYDLVLRAQSEAASLIRPGATIDAIHKRAREILEKAGYGKYFTHGTSHFLGLEVHDPGKRDWPFEPGAVLTVEPGIYLPEQSLGIRIEDDYLVTESGARKLSAAAPSSIDQIEKVVNSPNLLKK